MAQELLVRDPDGAQVARLDDLAAAARSAAGQVVDAARAWTEQLGPFYDTEGVRHLLAGRNGPVSRQAVSKRRGLLALTTGSGRVVYPRFQFRDGAPLPGLDRVLAELPESLVSRWTVASWLVSPSSEFAGARPVDLAA